MPWSNQGGGWQGGGGGRGPWGQGPRGNGPSGPGGGGFGGGPNPPNLEELLRRRQDRFRQFMPGGSVSARAILLLILVAIAVWFGTGFSRVGPDAQGAEIGKESCKGEWCQGK